jgi:hypothetical protein
VEESLSTLLVSAASASQPSSILCSMARETREGDEDRRQINDFNVKRARPRFGVQRGPDTKSG